MISIFCLSSYNVSDVFLRLVAGLDDAGRGSVIGPLVIAGVLFSNEKIASLTEIGVKDSKLLSSAQRFRLTDKIKEQALRFKVKEINPREIDRVVFRSKKFFRLNWLEAKVMAELINELKPDIAYVDASDVNPGRFKETIENMLTRKVELISEHKADMRWSQVGAASILAKVHRDLAVEKIKSQFGDFGSGYPSDPKTVKFLKVLKEEKSDYPVFVRKSWKTISKLDSDVNGKQTRLT